MPLPQHQIGAGYGRLLKSGRSESLGRAIVALCLIISLFAATAPAAGSSTKEVLEGLTLDPHERWTTGAVKGWSLGDCIPFRFTLENRGSGSETLDISLAFDHQRDGVTGILDFESFELPAGSIDGPAFDGREGSYLWSVTVPGKTTYQILWCARLSEEAGLWPGASIHVSAKNGGSRDVPIMTKDLSEPRPPCEILGPEGVCENDPVARFSYGDDPTGLQFAWSLSATGGGIGVWHGSSIEIDWRKYTFGRYLLALDVYELRGGVLTKINTCSHEVLYIESPHPFIR